MDAICYKKLYNGNWGLMGPGLASGQVVTVFKRGGGVETETVGDVLTTTKKGLVIAKIAGRIARGPRGKGVYSHVFTAPRDYDPDRAGDYEDARAERNS
jgi:hypothetical protein